MGNVGFFLAFRQKKKEEKKRDRGGGRSLPFGAAQVGRVGRSVGGVATPRRRSAEANFAAGTEPLCLPHGRPTTPFFRPFSSFFFLFDDQRPLKKKGEPYRVFPEFFLRGNAFRFDGRSLLAFLPGFYWVLTEIFHGISCMKRSVAIFFTEFYRFSPIQTLQEKCTLDCLPSFT